MPRANPVRTLGFHGRHSESEHRRVDVHFISGLPRSGSTLLSALLSQNPRIHASMTSPVYTLFHALQRKMSQESEFSLFIDDRQRSRILRACFEAYYHEIVGRRSIFDTNRLWTTKIAALSHLFPDSKVICCVRNVAWVVDSIESLVRRNSLEPSKLFNFDPGGSVYTRAELITAATGMVGESLFALRESVYGDQADRLLLVRYETLTSDPLGTLAKIYEFTGLLRYDGHDPEHVEPSPGTEEFDARLGMPGLHRIGSSVRQHHRRSILPTELFARYEPFSFWQRPGELPPGIRLI
jgi:sulfotransferase